MRLTASAPVTWPDRAALDRWWRAGTAEVDATEVAGDRSLRFPRGAPDDLTVRLASGTHLAPGATYELLGSELGSAQVGAVLGGVAGRRTAEVTLSGRRGLLGSTAELVRAEVAGLDAFDQVVVTSTHPYLLGELHLLPDAARPLTLDLRLRWLQVSLVVDVVGEELTADLQISARGAWAPATAPLLALIGRMAGSELQPFVTDCARTLTAVAEGEPPPAPMVSDVAPPPLPDDAELAAARWACRQARERWTRAQDAVEAAGWWGSRRRAWMRAYDALPPAGWPAREPPARAWEDVARSAAEAVARAPRAQRRARIEREAQWFGTPEIPVGLAASTERAVRPRPLTEEDLALRWLRSPLSTWAYLRRSGDVAEEPPEGAAAEDWAPDPSEAT